jgi:energy-coupling factor transporter ATP-binding protein EcfA2
MIFESMVESILMYGTENWGWKEQEEVVKSARKIFEVGARSGQRNARLHSEGRE